MLKTNTVVRISVEDVLEAAKLADFIGSEHGTAPKMVITYSLLILSAKVGGKLPAEFRAKDAMDFVKRVDAAAEDILLPFVQDTVQ
jgi:hypothetical protein